MSVPETLSTMCLSRGRTPINLPASKRTVPCYDECDAAWIEQTDLFYSPDIRILFESLGASSCAFAVTFTISVAFTRERKTVVRTSGRVD